MSAVRMVGDDFWLSGNLPPGSATATLGLLQRNITQLVTIGKALNDRWALH